MYFRYNDGMWRDIFQTHGRMLHYKEHIQCPFPLEHPEFDAKLRVIFVNNSRESVIEHCNCTCATDMNKVFYMSRPDDIRTTRPRLTSLTFPSLPELTWLSRGPMSTLRE